MCLGRRTPPPNKKKEGGITSPAATIFKLPHRSLLSAAHEEVYQLISQPVATQVGSQVWFVSARPCFPALRLEVSQRKTENDLLFCSQVGKQKVWAPPNPTEKKKSPILKSCKSKLSEMDESFSHFIVLRF